MHIDIEMLYYLNLGVDRPNITWKVIHMRARKSDLESLWLVLPKRLFELHGSMLTAVGGWKDSSSWDSKVANLGVARRI